MRLPLYSAVYYVFSSSPLTGKHCCVVIKSVIRAVLVMFLYFLMLPISSEVVFPLFASNYFRFLSGVNSGLFTPNCGEVIALAEHGWTTPIYFDASNGQWIQSVYSSSFHVIDNG